MKKTAFLLLALALPLGACKSTDGCGSDCTKECCEAPAEEMKTVAPEAVESMAMATFEFNKANP